MAVEVTDLTTLDPTAVSQQQASSAQQLQEASPVLDLKRGVLHDLVLYWSAVLDTKTQTELQRYLASRSLAAIQADPTLADPDVLDDVMSNWRISRQAGTASQGEVTIVLSGSASVTISNGTAFTANGKTFTTNDVYTAKSSQALINSESDRLLTSIGGGRYAFTVFVTATAVGTDSAVKKDTLIVPATLPTNYVTSYATDDFSGGTATETNDELLQRMQEGVAAKAPSNRVNMAAMLREQSDFSRVVSQSVIGFGDAEMLRDKHSIFPGSFGGRADWYIRTVNQAETVTLTKSATLIAKNDDGSSDWQVSLGRNEAPGFYELVTIRRPSDTDTAGSFDIISDIRDFDTSGDDVIPDIVSAVEAAYTRYQTAIIVFRDTVTDVTSVVVGAASDYAVSVSAMPQIADIQDFLNGSDVAAYGSDVLVKAPIPCFLMLSFTVAKNRTQTDPDTNAIKNALAAMVNTLGFVGRLYAGQVQDVIHNSLLSGMSVGSIDMLGRVRTPAGTIRYIRSDEVVVITGVDGDMVSERTAQFLLSPDDIAITISTDVPVPR